MINVLLKVKIVIHYSYGFSILDTYLKEEYFTSEITTKIPKMLYVKKYKCDYVCKCKKTIKLSGRGQT